MNYSKKRSLVLLAATLFVAAPTFAQYVWVDENGHKQFSDQAPPASVPKDKILKYKGKSSEKTDTTPAASSNDKTKQLEALADKEREYKKRAAEQAAKAKKDEVDAKVASEKADACKHMREYKQTLESGQPMGYVDDKGQRNYVSDDKRAADLNEMNQKLGECAD